MLKTLFLYFYFKYLNVCFPQVSILFGLLLEFCNFCTFKAAEGKRKKSKRKRNVKCTFFCSKIKIIQNNIENSDYSCCIFYLFIYFLDTRTINGTRQPTEFYNISKIACSILDKAVVEEIFRFVELKSHTFKLFKGVMWIR